LTERAAGGTDGQLAPPSLRIESREDLAFVLSEASTLEHMIMCEYLFAAFSLKRDESEGLTSTELDKVRGWEGVITTVAIQEMTHLALVNNMLVSIGSSPYFQHANFPQPSRYFSPHIRLALVPFGERALRHFIYLERPEGMSVEGVPGFEALGDLNPPELKGGITPHQQYFTTVGNLYRGVEKGFENLVAKYGEDTVFLGARRTQADEAIFGLPNLFPVRDLASARQAVEGIVEMGEGARGDWKNAHFGMFLGILKEFMEIRRSKESFHPTRPVVSAFTRPPFGVEDATLISDGFTAKIADLFNASYGLAIQTLSRFYVHEGDRSDELRALADSAVGIMSGVIKPLGILLTVLPVGASLPGVTAGASFELQHKEYILPHREEAMLILRERLVELAGHAANLAGEASPSLAGQLRTVQATYLELAQALGASARGT